MCKKGDVEYNFKMMYLKYIYHPPYLFNLQIPNTQDVGSAGVDMDVGSLPFLHIR
jgi:hypothetical protein